MKRNGLTMFCQGLWQVLIWSYTCRLKVLKSEKWFFFLLLQRLMKHAEIVLGSWLATWSHLSQHYSGPKVTFCHFSNFCRKVSRLDKKVFAHFCVTLWVLICKNNVAKPLDLLNESRRLLLSSRVFFLQKFEKWLNIISGPM